MNRQRRMFLKTGVAAGALALSSAPFISSYSGPDRRDLPDEGSFDHVLPGLDGERAKILYYASLAPSGHNAQPWTVTVADETSFIIGFDRKRTLPAVDPDNRELLLSIGTFIENLCLAAGSAGLDPKVDIISQGPEDQNVAKVILHNSQKKEYPLKRLELRRTVKSGLLSREIRKADVEKFAQPFKGRLFYFPTGTKHGVEANKGSRLVITFVKSPGMMKQ